MHHLCKNALSFLYTTDWAKKKHAILYLFLKKKLGLSKKKYQNGLNGDISVKSK